MGKQIGWFVAAALLLAGCATPRPSALSIAAARPTAATATMVAPPVNTPLAVAVGPDDQLRLDFFHKGGWWSVLMTSEAGANENQVLVLTGPNGLQSVTTITIGSTTTTDAANYEAALKVLDLFEADAETLSSFAAAFANGIERGELTASIVTTGPIPDDHKIAASASTGLSAAEFMDAAQAAFQLAAVEATASPTHPAVDTPPTPATLALATPAQANAVATTPAAASGAAPGIVAIPQLPTLPAIPKITIPTLPVIPTIAIPQIPQIPTVPRLPAVALTPIIPVVPGQAEGAAPGAPDAPAISASTGITLSGAFEKQISAGTATADSITLDLVVSADAAQVSSTTLHLKNVKCPSTTIGGLDQTHTQPVPIVDGKFTVTLSEKGKIEGELIGATSAKGAADLFITLTIAGFPDIECDLGQWQWTAAID
jgi:hypothetical protein